MKGSLYLSDSVISQQAQLDKFTGILLELPARHRESPYSGLLVEYSPQWVSLAGC